MTAMSVQGLTKDFTLREGRTHSTLRAVDDVSFDLVAGETVALVGESGSGKSTIARMLAQLERPTAGTMLLDGAEPGRRGRALRTYRERVQMVFQDPFASLNPYHTIDHHLRRPLRVHGVVQGAAAETAEVHRLLERVNLLPAGRVAAKRPQELSGGQRQRIAIARALACRPKVLLADEPVSMLDVSIRLEILNLINRLKDEDDLAVLYITHDLATARHFSTSVMVLYRGQVVERGPSDEVILRPQHPYTQLLAGAAPDPRRRGLAGSTAQPTSPVPTVPTPARAAGPQTAAPVADSGCLFRDRCPSRMPVCDQPPPLFELGGGSVARCWLHEGSPATTATHVPTTA